jgi:hypothetical protein
MASPAEEDSGTKRGLLATLGRVLKHPLVIALLAATFTAIFLPQFTRQWQDRQKERALKQTLLEQMSNASNTAVTQAISFAHGLLVAAGAGPGEDGKTAYALLRNSWIVRRAGIESTILTYFPKVDSCWYSYELAISDFISLSADNNALNRKTRVSDIRRYLESNFARSYVWPRKTDPACARLQELPLMIRARLRKDKLTLDASKNGRSNWDRLTLPTTDPHFSRGAYAVLGEALLFGDETIIRTVSTSNAKDFAHGWF